MPQLENFPVARQAVQNSCWACAARAISNWYRLSGSAGENQEYSSDQVFANAWRYRTGDAAHGNINIQQSAVAALEDVGYDSGADELPLPAAQEIKSMIANQQPLLAIVGSTNPKGARNLECHNGHWVVIVGISDDDTTLSVFDPDDGQIHDIAYSASTYIPGFYWQNTSYIDPQ